MEFEDLKIEHLGRDEQEEGGRTVLQEADDLLQSLWGKVVDDDFTDDATITITVSLKRAGNGVVVDGRVKKKEPVRKRRTVQGMVLGGSLKIEKAQQLPMYGENVRRLASGEEGED